MPETSTEQPAALELGNFLPYRLSVTANKVSRLLAGRYAERFGITVPQWRVIAVLGQSRDVTAEFVCSRTEMDQVTVSRAVAALVRRKLVVRRIASHDRRCSMLRLSAAGARIYAAIVPMALEFETHLLDSLTAVERRALTRALDRLTAAVAAMDEPA